MSANQNHSDYMGSFKEALKTIFSNPPSILTIPYKGGTLLKLQINSPDLTDNHMSPVKTLEEAMILANIKLENPQNTKLSLQHPSGSDISNNGNAVLLIKKNTKDQWTGLKAIADACGILHNQPKKRILGYLWE